MPDGPVLHCKEAYQNSRAPVAVVKSSYVAILRISTMPVSVDDCLTAFFGWCAVELKGWDMDPAPYKTTPEWDETSLPAAIRGEHSTKAGVWGILRVLDGEVELVFVDPSRRVRVNPSMPGLIRPQEVHHVELVGPMRMQVEFYKTDPGS